MTSIEHHTEDNHRRYAPAARQYDVPERQVRHEAIARLRAFAILLCMDVNLGEELVKVTLLRACVAIDPGGLSTNLTTWLIRRLRGYYYREYARRPAVTPPGGRASSTPIFLRRSPSFEPISAKRLFWSRLSVSRSAKRLGSAGSLLAGSGA